MTTQSKLVFFVVASFVLIGVALRFPALGYNGRGLLILAGGWLLAVSSFYQVQLLAEEKDVLYYLMVVFAGVIGLSMSTLTLFWLWTLLH